MKLIDKILFVILLLICLTFACTNAYCTFVDYLTTFGCFIGLDEVIGNVPTAIFDILISFGLLVVVYRLFFAVFFTNSNKSEDIDFIPVFDSNDSTKELAYILPDAIEQIAKKHVLSHRSVSECKAYLSSDANEDNFTISIAIIPIPDANIPTISAELKESVVTTVEAQTGIHISDVLLYVFPQGNKISKSNIL